MTTSPFIIDYILNAQIYHYRSEHNSSEDLKYWVYTVKWYSEHGHIIVSRENEFHHCFKKDPSILQLFWEYCKIDPETYTMESAVVKAPGPYMAYCKERGSASMRECPRVEPSNSRARQPSTENLNSANDQDNGSVIVISDDSDPEPQGAKVDIDSECESLFGDSFYIPRVSSPIMTSPSKSPTVTSPPSSKQKGLNGTPESMKISRKVFHNGTGKITAKRSTLAFAYEQFPSDVQQTPTSTNSSFNGHHRSIDIDGMSSIVERRRTPDMVLPAIAVLEDLPDYDEESSHEEVTMMIDELDSSSRHPTPPVIPPADHPEHTNHDVEMAELEPQPQVSSPPNPSQKQPTAAPLPNVDSDDEDLYVPHDHVIDPSTFVPISQLIQPQTQKSQLPASPEPPANVIPQTQLLSPLRLEPHSPTVPHSATEIRSLNLPPEQQTPNSTFSSPSVSPKNTVRHTAATAGFQPTSPRNNRRAIPKTPQKAGLPLQISIPPPNRSVSPPPKFPSFSLRLENDVILPLHVKDDRSSAFKDFLERTTAVGQREPLAVHGYYLHNDYAKFIQGKTGIRVASGYGRLWLDDNTETQIRQHWTSLRNDLNTRPLCLISLLPTSDEAFVIFSSLSYDFRDAIKADKWSMGYRDNGLTIARVKLYPEELPFAKQYR